MLGKHYTLAELELYNQKKMSSLQSLLCKHHLKHCAECINRMKELEKDNQFADEICRGLEDLNKFNDK